jgi:hypothetical protein
MKVYLAARYSRHPEMQHVAQALIAQGYEVTSRWIWGEHQSLDEHLLHPEVRSDSQRFAQEDIADLHAAECFIGFSEALRLPSRGGRHVELGMALALGKRVCVVGGLEHVFHALPHVEHYATLEALLQALGTAP